MDSSAQFLTSAPHPSSSSSCVNNSAYGHEHLMHRSTLAPPLPLPSAATAETRMPEDATLLALPDAQLCTHFRLPLQTVWQWRRSMSRRVCPSLFARPSTAATSLDHTHNERRLRKRLPSAADLLPHRARSTNTASSSSLSALAVVGTAAALPTLPTGLPTLDGALLGGLRRGWITELTGPLHSGKTTVAVAWCQHMLRVSRASPASVDAGARAKACDCVWLQSSPCVEAAVLSMGNALESSAEHAPADAAARTRNGLDAVHVACLSDIDALQNLLQKWYIDASALQSVGVIVIDSITDLVRRSFSYRDQDALQRHDTLASVLQTLKRLAEARQVAVLLLTQQYPLHTSPFRGDDAEGSKGSSAGLRYDDRDQLEYNADEYRDDSAYHAEDDDKLTGRRRHYGAASQQQQHHTSAADGLRDGGLSTIDIGELGRLFFHNVNVRLQLRTARHPRTGIATYSSFPMSVSPSLTASFSKCSAESRWQLNVVKCPLCAPFALALQLRVTSFGGSGVGSPVLALAEAASQPEDELRDDVDVVGVEGLFASVDPWDFTETPTFVYL